MIRTENRLAKKVGLSEGETITFPSELLEKMETAVRMRTSALAGAFGDEISAMRELVRAKPEGWREATYFKAHDIRGLAGTFGRDLLGRFAASLCLYFEDLEDKAKADAAIVTGYAEAMVSALKITSNTDEIAEKLLSELQALGAAHSASVR